MFLIAFSITSYPINRYIIKYNTKGRINPYVPGIISSKLNIKSLTNTKINNESDLNKLQMWVKLASVSGSTEEFEKML